MRSLDVEVKGKTMIRATEIGKLFADRDEVIIFSLDEVAQIAERLNIPVGELVEEFGGVRFPILEGVELAVNKCHVMQDDGEVVEVALVGSDPTKFVRFLAADEMSFEDFLKSHTDYCIVGEGEFFNEEVYNEIAEEYRQMMKVKWDQK